MRQCCARDSSGKPGEAPIRLAPKGEEEEAMLLCRTWNGWPARAPELLFLTSVAFVKEAKNKILTQFDYLTLIE